MHHLGPRGAEQRAWQCQREAGHGWSGPGKETMPWEARVTWTWAVGLEPRGVPRWLQPRDVPPAEGKGQRDLRCCGNQPRVTASPDSLAPGFSLKRSKSRCSTENLYPALRAALFTAA